MIELFDDQAEIVEKVRQQMKFSKSILLQSPTGSGKTAMAKYMIASAKNKNRKIIFSVPRRDLMEQTSESFLEEGISHSFIAANKPFNPYAKVWIGMVDSMARRVDSLPKCDLLIPDETHFGAGSLDTVINKYKKDGSYILGLSATPVKLSGEGLGKWYDTMVEGKSIDWLINNKRLSDYRYFYGKTKPDLSKLSVTAGDYSKGQLADFMENQRVIIGDCVNDYINRAMGRLHIVRCASIKHSQMTAQAFRDSGIPAVHVDGDTPQDERKRIFKAYARREILVLCFCDLLTFGFDLSQASGMDVCIESGSDLKPTRSLSSWMQYIGRMLRYKDYPAIIMDHVNNYVDHGLPRSDREWSLDGIDQSKSSKKRAPATRQCPECFHVHPPAPVCTNDECCFLKETGYRYRYEIKSRDIDHVEGELTEANEEEILKYKKEKAESIRRGIYTTKGSRLIGTDKKTLDFLISKFKREGHKNPAAKAAAIMANKMSQK